jgi:hypothetical protein
MNTLNPKGTAPDVAVTLIAGRAGLRQPAGPVASRPWSASSRWQRLSSSPTTRVGTRACAAAALAMRYPGHLSDAFGLQVGRAVPRSIKALPKRALS